MKTKNRKFNGVTETRILQLSNDLTEGIQSGSLHEWRAVAFYWRQKHDLQTLRIHDAQQAVSGLVIGRSIIESAMEELVTWRDNVRAEWGERK